METHESEGVETRPEKGETPEKQPNRIGWRHKGKALKARRKLSHHPPYFDYIFDLKEVCPEKGQNFWFFEAQHDLTDVHYIGLCEFVLAAPRFLW